MYPNFWSTEQVSDSVGAIAEPLSLPALPHQDQPRRNTSRRAPTGPTAYKGSIPQTLDQRSYTW